MTRFRELLKHDPLSSPAEEQRRASEGLAGVVRQSRLRWKDERPLPSRDKYLLVAVAPYSQYDLVLLDLLDEKLASACASVPVYVSNLLHYGSAAQLREDFPGVGEGLQPPMAALFEAGSAKAVASGNKARELVADSLGIPGDELTRRVLDGSPSSRNSEVVRALLAAGPPEKHTGELEDDQLQFLWKAYRAEQDAGGPAREGLPYSPHFERICGKMNAHFQKAFGRQEIWNALSNLDKTPARRRSLGLVDSSEPNQESSISEIP